jgi:hypothetical protein
MNKIVMGRAQRGEVIEFIAATKAFRFYVMDV